MIMVAASSCGMRPLTPEPEARRSCGEGHDRSKGHAEEVRDVFCRQSSPFGRADKSAATHENADQDPDESKRQLSLDQSCVFVGIPVGFLDI
jgi:hypothetical protein